MGTTQQDPRRIPVLIVGGGPVGLALAADLGWRGVTCELIEQGSGVIETPRMNEVNVRTMEFCRRWGIDGAVHACPFPYDYPLDVVFVTSLGGYELARQERPSRKEQQPGPLSPMNRQVCAQTWFDPMVQSLARSFPSVTLRYRRRLESFTFDDDGVTADIIDVASGERERLRADYMVACDGANSAIRRALGIGLTGPGVLGHPVHLFFRAPGLLEKCGREPGTFFLAIDRDGLWANIRVIDPAQGLWRLMVLDTDGNLTPETVDREAYLRRALGFDLDVEWAGVSVWTRRGVVAERYVDGRVFIAGDAAHQLSPTGALGMNTGMGDAVDLGWKLAAVIQGWGGDALLRSYDSERRPIGLRNVNMATEFYLGHGSYGEGFAAIEEQGPVGDAMRERIGGDLVRDLGRMFRSLGVQLGYRYEPSPICVPDGTPPIPDDADDYTPSARPGGRAPHVWLDDGRSALDLYGRDFVLLRLGGDAPDARALITAAAERGLPLTVEHRSEPALRAAYECPLVLVRPDGHVAWRGDSVPADALRIVDRVRGAVAGKTTSSQAA